MEHAVRGGLILGALVAAWTLVMGFTGWYRHPTLAALFFVVVLVQIGVIVAVLRKTREGRTWGGQIRMGLITSAIGAVIIFLNSLLFTVVLFPTYFDDLRAGQREQLKNAGMSDADVETAVASTPQPTVIGQAVSGVVGTLATGLVVSAIAGAFLRSRAAADK
jgi:hypothetical protein